MNVIILLLMLLFSGIINIASAQNEEVNFDKIFCYRFLEKQNNVITVTLFINTKGLEREKRLKVKEKFPASFYCRIKESYGSTNAVTDEAVIFVWFVLPTSDLFYVKYELISQTPINENESVNIIGYVSFLTETGIKYVSIKQKDFINSPAIASKMNSIPPYSPGAEFSITAESSNTVSNVAKSITDYIPDTTTPKPIVRTNIKEELETNKTLAITTEETVTDSIKTLED